MTKENDDLKGFEELFEDNSSKKTATKKKDIPSGLELLNFLNYDQKRLQKINELFEIKLSSNFNISHMKTYLDKQIEENIEHRKELYRILSLKDSYFLKECNTLIDFHFKQIKNPS